jgi:hypothetical protein
VARAIYGHRSGGTPTSGRCAVTAAVHPCRTEAPHVRDDCRYTRRSALLPEMPATSLSVRGSGLVAFGVSSATRTAAGIFA